MAVNCPVAKRSRHRSLHPCFTDDIQRQDDAEGAACAFGTLHRDAPAVPLYDLPHDMQAQPKATCPCSHIRRTVERLKQAVVCIGGNTDALIFDLHHGLTPP